MSSAMKTKSKYVYSLSISGYRNVRKDHGDYTLIAVFDRSLFTPHPRNKAAKFFGASPVVIA